MGDTTRVESGHTVRLKPRYWFLVLLMLLVVGVWPTWHVTLAAKLPNLAGASTASHSAGSTLTPWQGVGLFAMLLGAALFVVAAMDRFRTGRGHARQPKDKRVAEAYQVARANWVLSTVIPLAVAVAAGVRFIPAPLLNSIEHAARWLFPNLPTRL